MQLGPEDAPGCCLNSGSFGQRIDELVIVPLAGLELGQRARLLEPVEIDRVAFEGDDLRRVRR